MMNRVDITDKKHFSKQVTQRFLEAMDFVLGRRNTGKVTAKQFGDIVGSNSSNINRMRLNPDENFVTLEACGRLCHHYKVSAAWLLCDVGKMFHDDQLISAYETLASRLNNVEESIEAINMALEIIRKNKPKT